LKYSQNAVGYDIDGVAHESYYNPGSIARSLEQELRMLDYEYIAASLSGEKKLSQISKKRATMYRELKKKNPTFNNCYELCDVLSGKMNKEGPLTHHNIVAMPKIVEFWIKDGYVTDEYDISAFKQAYPGYENLINSYCLQTHR